MKKSREVIAEFGSRGNRRVLVIRDRARQRVYVERYVHHKPKRAPTWPLTRDNERVAKAWARAYFEAPTEERGRLTVRQVWDAYWAVQRDALKARTQVLYAERWARFERFVGPETPAELVTVHTVDQFWLACIDPRGADIAPNQAKACVGVAKIVYRWAESRELITLNRVGLWKAPEGEKFKAKKIDEYRSDDADQMLVHCSPQDFRTWRPSTLVTLLADHGFRINAALHLTWDDVDFTKGRIWLRPEFDKRNRNWWRPMTMASYAALLTARWWRDHVGSEAPWVFFKAREKDAKPYSYGAAYAALLKLEVKAGIPHKPYRAFHGLRRMVVGNRRQETGDLALSMLWVGDYDLNQAKAYNKEREDELQALADGENG